MMRLSASRNQRSKGGFRLKLVLQICLLLAICTWLLYQVKHSHDKKRAFENKMTKAKTAKEPDLFDFGRKGLPFVKENHSISKTDAKDPDNEEEEEEGERDPNMKHGEAKREEGKRVGEDTIDELDQDRADEENEQEEEFFSEEEKDGHAEEDGLFDNKEGEDSGQEAREENYKRDDASSAVAHVETEEDSRAVAVNGTFDDAISIKNETLGYVASIRINNETMGYFAPIINVSNVSFGDNMTVTNADLSINGSRSTEVKNQNELSSHENNVSNNNQLDIQNDSKFNESVPNTQISQAGSSGFIPAQDQNYKSDASESHEPDDHHLGSTTNKSNETTTRSDPLSVPVIQNEVKVTNDKAAG